MKVIHKYILSLADESALWMPKEAEILSIQKQGFNICIWALVDDENEAEERFFEIYGTGSVIKGDMGVERKYLSTVQLEGFVWHIFERIN